MGVDNAETHCKIMPRRKMDVLRSSLVPRPPSEKSRKGLVTRMAMPRPRGIQPVTQSRVNVYTRGDNWSCAPLNSCMYSTISSLNMSDAVPSRSTLLPRERRAAQYKKSNYDGKLTVLTKAFPGRHTNTEIAPQCFGINVPYLILLRETSTALSTERHDGHRIPMSLHIRD